MPSKPDKIYAVYPNFEEDMFVPLKDRPVIFTVELPSPYHHRLVEEYMLLNSNYNCVKFGTYACAETDTESDIEHFTYLEFLYLLKGLATHKIKDEKRFIAIDKGELPERTYEDIIADRPTKTAKEEVIEMMLAEA